MTMPVHTPLRRFLADQSGAVTVDWVVLTGSLVGLGLAVMAGVSAGVQDASEDIEAQLKTGMLIKTSFLQYDLPEQLEDYADYVMAFSSRNGDEALEWTVEAFEAAGVTLEGFSDETLARYSTYYEGQRGTWADRQSRLDGWTGSPDDVAWASSEYGIDLNAVTDERAAWAEAEYGVSGDEARLWAGMRDRGQIVDCESSGCTPQGLASSAASANIAVADLVDRETQKRAEAG